jgi:hypothetical protein
MNLRLLVQLLCCGIAIAITAWNVPFVRTEGPIDLPSVPTANKKIVSFQEGVNGYQGTVDTEIWALAPTTILAKNPNASSDADNDGGESQVLVRFDNVFGDKEDQVPIGSTILSAQLVVSAFDQGSTVHLHRMCVPFTHSATWNSLVDGVSADGMEAARNKTSLTFGKIAANSSIVAFDVTDTIQYWASGHPNLGWVFINTGGNGWDFYASEFDDTKQRPKLTIIYAIRDDNATLIDKN